MSAEQHDRLSFTFAVGKLRNDVCCTADRNSRLYSSSCLKFKWLASIACALRLTQVRLFFTKYLFGLSRNRNPDSLWLRLNLIDKQQQKRLNSIIETQGSMHRGWGNNTLSLNKDIGFR